MVWLLGLLYSLHIVQSSLPSFEEIKARTRWCLGEGKHCSINLLKGFDFSLCCAPCVCTTILKDLTPNLLLSSEYKEHQCHLPPVLIANTTSGVNGINSTKEQRMDQIVDDFNKLAQTNNIEAYELTTKESESSNFEEEQSIKSKNNLSESHQSSYYSEESDLQHIVKRSIDPGKFGENVNLNITSIKGTKTIQSLDNIGLSLTGNSSEDLTMMSFNKDNSTETYADFGSNITESVEYRLTTNCSSELASELSTEFSNMTTAVISVEIKNSQEVKNNATSLNSTFSATSSEIFPEEDWHSSQMQYDTRPMLRKVVTVLPFHFFDSVKVIPINESIETSAD